MGEALKMAKPIILLRETQASDPGYVALDALQGEVHEDLKVVLDAIDVMDADRRDIDGMLQAILEESRRQQDYPVEEFERIQVGSQRTPMRKVGPSISPPRPKLNLRKLASS